MDFCQFLDTSRIIFTMTYFADNNNWLSYCSINRLKCQIGGSNLDAAEILNSQIAIIFMSCFPS